MSGLKRGNWRKNLSKWNW